MEDGHTVNIAGAFAAIAIVGVDIRFRGAWIEIKLPDFLQVQNFAAFRMAANRFKSKHITAAAGT